MARLNELPFVKGHGTGNDFVVLPDVDGRLDLTPEQVRWLCDRRKGIGADGVLRVVRTEHEPEFAEFAPVAEYFMDHRNADGSTAEMCGNGARVFVRYLAATGLTTDNETVIATRGGLRSVTIESDRSITIDMGKATTTRMRALPIVAVGDRTWSATGVLVPNPHAVAFVDSLDDAGDLRQAPDVTPGGLFPDGVNVEFAVLRADRHVAMRVHERGVGETLSCGTGACAVAWAARRQFEPGLEGESTWVVEVPGGTLRITETAEGAMLLNGPADLVARGTVLLPL
ncbi:MAG: diaminopimelate epimerase [Actinomycetota bacterium]|nr:diaminopimelate epimerase [Actinomycetota bacterium]